MKTYIGTKTVNATPMTRGDYNKFRGWETPGNENPDDEGYIVEYTDGGKPNVPAYKGYVSWSPKDVFEKSYRLYGTPLERVRLEFLELEEKRHKLADFVESPAVTHLSRAHQILLQEQLGSMNIYADTLLSRIRLFESSAE
jgi:hypothetical protein